MSVVPWLKTFHIDYNCDSFSGCDIFFGITHWLLLNHNIIVGKHIIYHNSLPTLSHLIANLKYIESIERSITKENNRPRTQGGKWKSFLSAVWYNA